MATHAERNQGAGAFSTPGIDQKPETGPSQIITQNPVVAFKLSQVEPPSPLYLSQAERLQLVGLCSDGNVGQLQLSGRLLRASDGQISPFILTMNMPANRVGAFQTFDMSEGYILALQVQGAGGTTRGRCYVGLSVVRGAGQVFGNLTQYQQLIADYISRQHNGQWPNGEYIASVEGAGWAHGVAGTTPAAGAEITETVPTGARWRVYSFRFRLVTSAAAANRSVKFAVDDGVNVHFIGSFNFVQAASLTQDYELALLSPFQNDATQLLSQGPMPENLLFAGSRLRTITNNIQAGDQYSFVAYQVEEWIEQ